MQRGTWNGPHQGVSAFHRRNLFVITAAAAGAVWVWVALRGAGTAPAPSPPAGRQVATTSTRQVRIVLDDPPASTWPGVNFQIIGNTAPDVVQHYLQTLGDEMSKYPPAFLQRSGLRTIAVVKNLSFEGQERAALPDPYRGVLYLDALCASHDRIYERHVIHHEFFHYVQAVRTGDFYSKDATWSGFNPPEFRYGAGGARARDPKVTPLTHPAPGFVNLYSQSALEEDMAEVFAVLRVPEERKQVERWARTDAILRQKMDYLEAFFEEWSRPIEAEATQPVR
jgi:hypothetical protein